MTLSPPPFRSRLSLQQWNPQDQRTPSTDYINRDVQRSTTTSFCEGRRSTTATTLVRDVQRSTTTSVRHGRGVGDVHKDDDVHIVGGVHRGTSAVGVVRRVRTPAASLLNPSPTGRHGRVPFSDLHPQQTISISSDCMGLAPWDAFSSRLVISKSWMNVQRCLMYHYNITHANTLVSGLCSTVLTLCPLPPVPSTVLPGSLGHVNR